MSVNALRAKLKKKLARGNETKLNIKGPDKAPSPVLGFGDASKRKAHSVSSPPEVHTSPNHQLTPRKVSLGIESPAHSASCNPPSPLVMKTTSMTNIVSVHSRRDSSPASNSVTIPQYLPTVNVVGLNLGEDLQSLDRQGIIDITADVQNFLAAISRLKQAMEEADSTPDNEESARSAGVDVESETTDIVQRHIFDLVQVVQTCLGQHNAMQSTEIKNAAKSLTQFYQNCPHTTVSTCAACSNAIESLIDAFTNSVSEYLTGETVQLPKHNSKRGTEKSNLSNNMIKGFSKSHDNLALRYSSYIDLSQQFTDPIVDQIDQGLTEVEDGVEVATRYIKTRLKYHREITAYLNKRAQIEARYHQQISKLGRGTQMAIDDLSAQEASLPLVDVFRDSIDHDIRFASNCNTTYNTQVENKLTGPLEQISTECDKRKKELTQTWNKEVKKLADARTAMKNAKARYIFLGQDLVRVKNLLALDPYGKQADKRKKDVADYVTKWQDAEAAYKSALAFCNDCQYQVHATAQKSILCACRRLVIEADMQLKSGLEAYFTLQHNFFQTLTEPVAQSFDMVREYDVGSEFMKHISRQTQRREDLEDYLFVEFDPEEADLESNGIMSDGRVLPNSTSTDSTFLSGDNHTINSTERSTSPHVFHRQDVAGSLSVTADSHSPRINNRRKERPRSIAYLLDTSSGAETKNVELRRKSEISSAKDRTASPLSDQEEILMSVNAIAHSFKKLRGPSRCRECDTYVYFHGYECDTCGLACHRKCLADLAIKCGSKRLARKMNTFGVDFQKHLKATKRYIPIIVTECIAELDLRGLDTRGLYRVSSAKTKLEHLCQLFETGGDRVDLSGRPAHLIGSCLKLYFRQLPEPLLSFALYQDFVTFAREASYILPCKLETLTGEKAESALQMLDRLKGLLQKLPYEHYITLAKLLYHLNRVSDAEHVKHNFMPPSNLGIVFAPNLLRQREVVASLTLLADMTAQAKAVEIMISHVHDIIPIQDEEILLDQDPDESGRNEMLVDDPVKSPQLEVDDTLTAGSRTPNTTPPERRRENVSELTDVLEALQLIGRRSSQPSLNVSTLKPPHPALGDVRNTTLSKSDPFFSFHPPPQISSERDTLTALGRLLRAPTHTPPPMEKMLTPVQEKQVENDSSSSDEENDCHGDILPSSSQNIDGRIFTRSESGLSNPNVSWTLFDVDSEVNSIRDNASLLSEGEDTISRGYKMSEHSVNGGSSNRKDSKRNGVQILGEEEDLENKDFSQGSDDSSSFAENCQGYFTSGHFPASPPCDSVESFPSSSEGTPSRKTSGSSEKHRNPSHLVFDLTSNKNSPHTETHSSPSTSESVSTKSSQTSQGSIPEASSTTTLKAKRHSKYERYEQFYQHNPLDSQSETEGKREPDSDANIEQSQSSTHSTDGSIGTITEDTIPDDEVRMTPVDSQNWSANKASPLHHNQEIMLHKKDWEPMKHQSEHWERMKEIQKQLDSGIDERGSPDTRSDRGNSLTRLTLSDGVNRQDKPRRLSHPVSFDSLESGLADSPDPDSLLNDLSTLNGLNSHCETQPVGEPNRVSLTDNGKLRRELSASEQREETPLQYEIPQTKKDRERRSKSSEPDFGKPRRSSHVEIVIPPKAKGDDYPKLVHRSDLSDSNDSIGSSDNRQFLSDFNLPLSTSAPRNFERPSFSNIARNPIRNAESRHSKQSENPPCDLPEKRVRSSSEDPPSLPQRLPFSPEHKSIHRAVLKVRSTDNVLSSSLSPSSSGDDLSSPGKSGLSKSLGTLISPSPERNIEDCSTSGPKKKQKWGKRLQNTFKPALRVLKITPSSARRANSDSPVDTFQDIHLSSHSPLPSPNPADFKVRVRMISPEVVSSMSNLESRRMLRRSRSFDDVLVKLNEDDEFNPTSVKVGSIHVFPETKSKSKRSRFFASFQGTKNRSKISEEPVVLVNVKKRKQCAGGEMLAGGGDSCIKSASPKNKKRSRLPHFV